MYTGWCSLQSEAAFWKSLIFRLKKSLKREKAVGDKLQVLSAPEGGELNKALGQHLI